MNTDLKMKIESILGENKELILYKGQLLAPMKLQKKDTNEVYYTFTLKVLKQLSSDEYGQSFNTINVVMPTDYVKNNKISDTDIQNMKNNEVVCILHSDSHVKKMQGQNNTTFNLNNISYYVMEISLTKELEKVSFTGQPKAIAL